MSLTSRTRFVNPRLGTYFGIFASSLAGLVLLLLIFEQLGTSDTVLRWGMLFGPLVLYAAIGLCVPTQDPLEFFAAGRRVPAGYTGLGIGVAALGATGMVAITGVFFLIGFDALCLMIGGLAGFVIMTVMLAPFFRKFGTFTVPSYLGRRFESKTVRLLSAMLLAVPALLMLAAELRMGAFAAGWLAGQPQTLMIVVLVGAFIVSVVARRHALLDVVEQRRGHRRGSRAHRSRRHRRRDGDQLPAAAAHQRPAAAGADAHRGGAGAEHRRGAGARLQSARRWHHPHRQALHGAVRRHRADRLRRRHADGDGGRRLLAVAHPARDDDPRRLRDAQVARLGDGLLRPHHADGGGGLRLYARLPHGRGRVGAAGHAARRGCSTSSSSASSPSIRRQRR